MVGHTVWKKRALFALIFALGYGVCALLCLFPLSHIISPAEEEYTVNWSDGTASRESYAAALSSLSDAEENFVVLQRNGMRGEIAASETYAKCVNVLQNGDLLTLLTADFNGLSRLERASLWHTFGNTAYYSADLFAFDGKRVFRTPRKAFETLVLLDSSVPNATVCETGATELILRSEAQFEAAALVGSKIERVTVQPPYWVSGGGIYLTTAGGKRLVSALPKLSQFEAEDCDFCDEGALAPCTGLVSLTLPFAGSAKSGIGSDFNGRLEYDFGGNVPETLRRVKITGGMISEGAFVGCSMLEELDLCSIPAENISPSAFIGCEGLQRLHTARLLTWKGMARRSLPCGCYLYERSTP